MKITKGRQILFYVSLIGIIVVTLVMGTTYAYQTLIVEYKEGSNNDVVVNAGKLDVSYENTNKINLKNMTILPDYKTADYTEFTIKTNDTSYDVAYQLNLSKLVYSNSLISENFKYTITLVDSDNEFVIGEGNFSALSGNNINLPFNMNTYRVIEKGKNETLRLYLWLKESDSTLNIENSSFQGNIEIVSLFSNETEETFYKKFKVYGNSTDVEENGNNKIENLGSKTKNLIDYKNFKPYNGNIRLIEDGLEYTGTYYVSIDGSSLIPGKYYTMSWISDTPAGIYNYWRIQYTDKTTSSAVTSGKKILVDSTKIVDKILLYPDFNSVPMTTKLTNIQLEEGEAATEYEPYGKYKFTVDFNGKNLYDVGKTEDYFYNLTDLSIEGNAITGTQKNDWGGSYIVKLTNYPSGDYVINLNKEGLSEDIRLIIRCFDSNGVQLDNTTITLPNDFNVYNTYYKAWLSYGYKNRKISIPENVAYWQLGFVFHGPTSNIGNATTLSNIQLERGTTPTEYEPYVEPINIILDEPLRKFNDEVDYIDVVDNKVVRNVKVIDNTSNLLLENSYAKLEVPKVENLGNYYIPYINYNNITICSENNVCASDIEIELNK